MARPRSFRRTTYPSKVDRWFLLVMAIVVGSLVIQLGVAATAGNGSDVLQIAVLCLVIIGLLVWITLGTHYTLAGRDLIIRSGPLSWRIAIDDIESIGEGKGLMNARSAPALSLDRLLITCRKGRRLLISPADKKRFLADLRDRQRLSD